MWRARLPTSVRSCKILYIFWKYCMLGIILAGGYSSRAKLNKLLLEINHRPLISYTIEAMRPFVDRIVVVTGRYHDELEPVLKTLNVDIVFNEYFACGMFSSMKAGIAEAHNEDILLIPGDIPNVSKDTYQALLRAPGSIRIPTFEGHDGHPLFLSAQYLDEIKQSSINSNMHEFLEKYESEKVRVPVDDPFICLDIDTIRDYHKFCELLERK